MNILHICSYYIGNKLYKNLLQEIDKLDYTQKVYIPIKTESLVGLNKFASDNVEFYFDVILRKYDRLFYRYKVKKQLNNIEVKVSEISKIDLIHAHTWFSDGGTAYLMKQKYDLDYVVSIRNTDINFFYKYAIQHRSFAHDVLLNASAIIFISYAYKQKTFARLPKSIVSELENKTYVIPNGIDNQWLLTDNTKLFNGKLEQVHLLFTGSLDRNKNLHTVINLIEKMVQKRVSIYLNVAGDGPLKKELEELVGEKNLYERVTFWGEISTQKVIELADQSDIFILPSYKETFGISYIEAMSRGLPIIYTKNEGIDGYFPEGFVGYSTNPDNIDEMERKVKLIIDRYNEISTNCIEEAKKFNWSDIANIYNDLYHSKI